MNHRAPGIILAIFGTARPHGLAVLEDFAAKARARFPGSPLAWAFSARFPGLEASAGCPNLENACANLAAQGAQSLVIQPLHCIPGAEYTALKNLGERLAVTFPGRVSLGFPLLRDARDAHDLARRMPHLNQPHEPGEIQLWVGHGSSHTGAQRYRELAQALRETSEHLLLGALRPAGKFADILELLRAKGRTRIRLIPFFSLTGRHTDRDLGGDVPESWRQRLEREGFSVRFLSRGMLEYPEFAALWLDRLQEAVAALEYPVIPC